MANSDRQSFLDRIRVSRQELNKITIITNQTLRITLKKRGRIRVSASATRLKRCRRTKPNVTTTEDTTADAESIV